MNDFRGIVQDLRLVIAVCRSRQFWQIIGNSRRLKQILWAMVGNGR